MVFHLELKHKNGVGSIIGAAFLLLILLTGFTYYNFYFNESRRYTRVLQDMQQLDFMRSSEEICFVGVSTTDQDKLNVTVKNTGSYQTHFIWIGIRDESKNSQQYYGMDFYVDPGETVADIRNETITIPDGESRGIQLITEYGNIFACSYPFESTDGGAATQSKVTIMGMGTSYNPTLWNLLNSTQNVSGSISDLTSNDNNYAVFESHSSGTTEEMTDFVDDDTSDVDGSADKGTHSDFDNEKAFDSFFDTLTETGTFIPAGVYIVKPSVSQDVNDKWGSEANAWDFDNATSAVNSRGKATDDIYWQTWNNTYKGTITSVDLHIRIDFTITSQKGSSDSVTIQWWVGPSQGVGTFTIDSSNDGNDLHISFLNTSEPNDGSWSWDDIGNIEIRQVGNQSGTPDTLTYSTDEVWGKIKTTDTTDYELDLEVQWTNANYSFPNEYLCIFGGSMGSEDIAVEVWDNSMWNNVLSDLSTGWNNISVSTYLTAPSFTIRFKGAKETADNTQDSWEIDAVLLHLWGGENIAEVEFIGVSNVENWTNLTWQVDSSYNIGAAGVTVQLYDFNSSGYATSGDGYYYYISDATPNNDQLINQTINLEPMVFRNSTGYWKIKIKGVKSTVGQFQMNVDLIEFKPRFECPGLVIPYNSWREYRVRAQTSEGVPLSYAYTSIFVNSTDVTIRNALTKGLISNPDWVYLDENGEYYLEVRSTSASEETFVLKVVVGSVIGVKTIIQEAP